MRITFDTRLLDCSQTNIFPYVCQVRSLSLFNRHLECHDAFKIGESTKTAQGVSESENSVGGWRPPSFPPPSPEQFLYSFQY